MGPIAFVLVFLVIPLAVALFAAAFFAALGLARLVASLPAGVWAVLAVAGVVVLGVRLWLVLRALPPRQAR